MFQSLGYTCDIEAAPSEAEARDVWKSLELAALHRNLFGLKQKMNEAEARRIEGMQQATRDFQWHLAEREVRARHVAAQDRAELNWLRVEVENLKRQIEGVPLQQLRGLGPWSLGAAGALHRASGRCPRIAARIKSLAAICCRALPQPGTSQSKPEGPQDVLF